jgi:hypothetical protein
MDYSPRGTGSIGLPKLRWKDQPLLQRNGTDREGPNLEDDDDDDDDDDDGVYIDFIMETATF